MESFLLKNLFVYILLSFSSGNAFVFDYEPHSLLKANSLIGLYPFDSVDVTNIVPAFDNSNYG